jgi:ankyrin repeat protein
MGRESLNIYGFSSFIFCFCSQLIKAGADLNVRDFDGWTPLMAAAHWGQEEACKVLLESTCDLSSKNNCVS